VLDQLLLVEGADVRLGVAYVDRQQHLRRLSAGAGPARIGSQS
jgi:hypothetical protein